MMLTTQNNDDDKLSRENKQITFYYCILKGDIKT